MSRTELVLDFVESVSADNVPPHAMIEAKRAFLDAVGCGIAGHCTDKGTVSIKAAEVLHGAGDHVVLNSSQRLSMAGAAFANAELIHAMDYCALTDPPAHATPFIIPALMVLAEKYQVDGKSFLAAVATAHELAYRLGLAISAPIKSENGGMVGGGAGFSLCVAATALAGSRMIGLDRSTTRNALGIAGFLAPVSGVMRFIQARAGHVAMTKMAPAGWMAEAGLTAVLWAASGYTGDQSLFDGEPNFGRLLGRPDWVPEKFTDGLGERWVLDKGMVYKQFPCGMPGHPLLECVIDTMRENSLAESDIREIVIYSSAVDPIFDNKKIESQTDVQFSVPYMVAMSMLGIEPGVRWFDKKLTNDEKIHDLMNKVRVAFNTDSYEAVVGGDRRRRWSARVDVVTTDKVFQAERLTAKGDPSTEATRTSDQVLIDKFITNLEQSGRSDGEQLAQRIWSMEDQSQLGPLLQLL